MLYGIIVVLLLLARLRAVKNLVVRFCGQARENEKIGSDSNHLTLIIDELSETNYKDCSVYSIGKLATETIIM